MNNLKRFQKKMIQNTVKEFYKEQHSWTLRIKQKIELGFEWIQTVKGKRVLTRIWAAIILSTGIFMYGTVQCNLNRVIANQRRQIQATDDLAEQVKNLGEFKDVVPVLDVNINNALKVWTGLPSLDNNKK